ncbi:hypothetical protein C0J52_23668 [Blattella germanica]|nr:hypothetical protein C0J52_23668 [Blattella germanica]
MYIAERTKKRREIVPEFYATDAMLYRHWTKENQELRHVTTRAAIHGFHHKICAIEKFHEPSETWVCKLCNKTCDKYHLLNCKRRQKSLTEYAKD